RSELDAHCHVADGREARTARWPRVTSTRARSRCRIENGIAVRRGGTGERCGLDSIIAHQVEDPLAEIDEIVGNDASVTAPPDRLGAHDGACSVPAQLHQTLQRGM